MIYKLQQNYILRGWDKAAWVLVHRPENRYQKIQIEEFQVLILCDGRTDFDSDYVTDGMRMILKYMEEKGVVRQCDYVTPIDEEQYYQYYNNRFVSSIFWSITGYCNFRCRHCYMDAPDGMLGELSHEDAIKLIDQMAECGVLRVDITGGEPFVRKDFWQLIDRIQYYKMAIGQVYTNGWLLTDDILDEFERRNLRPEFSISFDGVGWHDWMRGVKGAERAALKALELCIRRGFPVNVEMCIHKGNYKTLRETVNSLAEIGVTNMKVGNVSRTELWKKNSEGNAMDDRTYAETMLQYIPDFFQDQMPMNIMLTGLITLYKGSKEYENIPMKYNGTEDCLEHVLCGAVRYSCYITPEGRLLPCMPMTACKEQEKFPLVQEIGLKKGLSDSFYMKIADSRVKDLLESNSKCAACEHKYQCGGGCRAIALEQTGNLMGCDGKQCMLWKEGYVDRIRQVTEEAIAKYCTNDEGIS